MATVTALKKKIAALEAQVERATMAGMEKAIAKIRKLMADSGVTIEHLAGAGKRASAAVARKAVGAKKAKSPKSGRPPKYQDPKTGATWSGLGRIPAWIAKAKNRDAFLIDAGKANERAKRITPKTETVKQAATKRVAKTAVKKAATKRASLTKSATPKAQTKGKAAISSANTSRRRPAAKVPSAPAAAPPPPVDTPKA